MVQLQFLTGKYAGGTALVRYFPCSIGRAESDDVQVEESGVWERHLQIDLTPAKAFHLSSRTDADAFLNGQRLGHADLKAGDIIEAGSVKLQFWLSPSRQWGFQTRERLTWISLGILCACQILLIYRLLQ